LSSSMLSKYRADAEDARGVNNVHADNTMSFKNVDSEVGVYRADVQNINHNRSDTLFRAYNPHVTDNEPEMPSMRQNPNLKPSSDVSTFFVGSAKHGTIQVTEERSNKEFRNSGHREYGGLHKEEVTITRDEASTYKRTNSRFYPLMETKHGQENEDRKLPERAQSVPLSKPLPGGTYQTRDMRPHFEGGTGASGTVAIHRPMPVRSTPTMDGRFHGSNDQTSNRATPQLRMTPVASDIARVTPSIQYSSRREAEMRSVM
jgi:hypothetical protein